LGQFRIDRNLTICDTLKSSAVAAALDGVVAGSLALMAVVAIQLGRASIVDWITLIIFGASLFALLQLRVNSAWIVALWVG
jgi:chromate transporter